MTFVPIKYYQSGSFVVGNRLLEEEQRAVQAGRGRSNSLTSGHRACQGCGEALGARYAMDAAMRATQGQLIAANATGAASKSATRVAPTSRNSLLMVCLHELSVVDRRRLPSQVSVRPPAPTSAVRK